MKLETLYKYVNELWPSEIDISDAKILSSNSGLFPLLSKAWNEAEKSLEQFEYNEFYSLGVWSYYQELHKLSLIFYRSKRLYVNKNDVSISMFDTRVRQNLNTEDYEEEKAIYDQANQVSMYR